MNYLEEDFERIFPYPYPSFYNKAKDKAFESVKNLPSEEAFKIYGSILSRYLEYYKILYKEEYKEYLEKVKIWKKDKAEYIRRYRRC